MPEILTNPATFVWSGRSQLGAVYGTLKQESDVYSHFKGSEVSVHGRYVGEAFALAGEYQNQVLKVASSPGQGAGYDVDMISSMIGVAYAFNEVFSLGLAQESGVVKAPNEEFSATLPLIGIGLRIGGLFYMGYGFGTEALKEEDLTVGYIAESKRSVSRLGFAFRETEGDVRQRYELALEKRSRTFAGGSIQMGNQDHLNISAELGISEFLGGLGIDSTDSTLSGLVSNDRPASKTVGVYAGWVPEEALALTVGQYQTTTEGTFSGKTVYTLIFIGAAWRF